VISTLIYVVGCLPMRGITPRGDLSSDDEDAVFGEANPA
jgi:hypothetical protein